MFIAFALLADAVLTLSPAIVALVAGVVSPWLVAAISHINAPPRLKQTLGGFVALLVGLVGTYTVADGSASIPLTVLASTIVTFLAQQASYLGLWRRLNLNRWRWLLPALGIGKPPPV